MKLGLDLDGTITANPALFVFLATAWLANAGEVHIITARRVSDTWVTHEELRALFGHHVTDLNFSVHIYPHDYAWPVTDQKELEQLYQDHATWKAELCATLQIDTLIDDNWANVTKCREAGIFSLHCGTNEQPL